MISYISTRGNAPALTFAEVLLTGLAPDGGLYVPSSWPTNHSADPTLPYAQYAAEIMWPFVEGSMDRSDFDSIAAEAYASFSHPDVIPISTPVSYTHLTLPTILLV